MKPNSSTSMNLFVAKSLSFFVTKTFVANGAAGHAISDKTHFFAEFDK